MLGVGSTGMLKDTSEGLGVIVDLVSENRRLIKRIGGNCRGRIGGNCRGWVRVWKIQ